MTDALSRTQANSTWRLGRSASPLALSPSPLEPYSPDSPLSQPYSPVAAHAQRGQGRHWRDQADRGQGGRRVWRARGWRGGDGRWRSHGAGRAARQGKVLSPCTAIIAGAGKREGSWVPRGVHGPPPLPFCLVVRVPSSFPLVLRSAFDLSNAVCTAVAAVFDEGRGHSSLPPSAALRRHAARGRLRGRCTATLARSLLFHHPHTSPSSRAPTMSSTDTRSSFSSLLSRAQERVPPLSALPHLARQGAARVDPRQHPETLQLQLVIKSLSGCVRDRQALAREEQAFAKQLFTWSKDDEGADVVDTCDRLAWLAFKTSELEQECAARIEESRAILKDIVRQPLLPVSSPSLAQRG